MIEVLTDFITMFFDAYMAFTEILPYWAQNFITIFMMVAFVVLYAIFIWKFYRFIAKKDFLGLNLEQYNTANHSLLSKVITTTLYLVEYVLISPFLIFFWFCIFTIFLILLTESLTLQQILLISVTIVTAIRMTSYIPNYGEELAKEIAKMLPFMLLTVSILTPNFFSVERIFEHLIQLPNYFQAIVIYDLFIIFVEIILRFFDIIFISLGIGPDKEED